MGMMFSILLIVVLNIVPGAIDTFTMEMPAGDVLQFDKQKNGGWLATELPKDEMGVYYVSGTQLGMMIAGKRTVHNLGDAIKDVVVSTTMPRVGEKPYCALEVFSIVNTGDKFYFTSPGMPPGAGMELVKND